MFVVLHFFNIIRIKQNEQNPTESNAHIFNTNLYTCLEPDKYLNNIIMKWTKEINLFQKRIIFIPIQQGIHWSLCVVISTGKIKHNANSNPDDAITYIYYF